MARLLLMLCLLQVIYIYATPIITIQGLGGEPGEFVELQENAEIGTFVANVLVDDPGAYCSLDSSVEDLMLEKLADGEYKVILIGYLNFEENPLHNLAIIRCMSEDGTEGREQLIIHVTDMNDHSPQVTINALNTDGISVSENSRPGTFVAHITVNDMDSGDNGRVSCFLDSSELQLEQIYQTEYKITTAVSLDREMSSSLTTQIECMDHGQPPRRSSEFFTVHVLDENDNVPMFMSSMYIFSIDANADVGSVVGYADAVDDDQGRNGLVRYSLQDDGECSDFFKISAGRGEIQVNQRLHALRGTNCYLVAAAADMGHPQRMSKIDVLVKIK